MRRCAGCRKVRPSDSARIPTRVPPAITDWLETKRLPLKPTTYARYRDCVIKDLILALGQVPLDELGYAHQSGYVHAWSTATAPTRCSPTWSS